MLKWWKIPISLFSLETAILIIYNLQTGSHPDERILFNLSLPRLIMVMVLCILLILSLLILWLSSRIQSWRVNFRKLVLDERFSGILIGCSGAVLAGDLYLSSINPGKFGDYCQLYLNFKPVLVWFYLISLQTLLFSTIWFCHFFLGKERKSDPTKYADELLYLFTIFILLGLVKIFFVIPSAYGPVIRGDEFRYFEMAKSLYGGEFSIKNFNHSPFLYPLLLSISFAFYENAYEVMKILNVVFSSSIVFPFFLIARKYLSRRDAFLITIIACILPYHLLFPRVIMSENLYFPILLWAILFVLHIPYKQTLHFYWHLITGVIIGLLYMTRFITLSIIPAFIMTWWLIYPGTRQNICKPGRKKLTGLFMLGSGIIIGYSPWIIMGYSLNIPIRLLLGFGITSETNASQLTFINLAIWISLYLSYVLLMAAPVLPVFTNQIAMKIKKWKEETRNWFILLATLLVGFTAACVRHSWRALYNSEDPARIMGRYILYFTPLCILSAFLLIEQMKDRSPSSSKDRSFPKECSVIDELKDRSLSSSKGRSLSSSKGRSFLKKASGKNTLPAQVLFDILLPLLLVCLSYGNLILNLFDLHGGDLINILGSVDVAYLQYLGIFYFLILLGLYIVNGYLIKKGNTQIQKILIFSTLMILYLCGLPAYYRDLVSYQNYQYLGKYILELHQSENSGLSDSIYLITPASATERDRALLLNTFHFYNSPDFYVLNVENNSGDKQLQDDGQDDGKVQEVKIIEVSDPEILKSTDGELVEFGNKEYLILF